MTFSPVIPTSHRDLAQAAGVGVLTTIGSDGYPQSTAIWYLLDGETLRTSLHPSRQKYRNLSARPTATFFLLDPANPYRTLEIRADVTIDDDPDLEFLALLLAHYGTTLEDFPAPVDGRVIVTLTPHHVVASGAAA